MSYHGYVFETNVASLPLDVDAADGTFEALLADIAEVMSISTHPDGRAQVLFARPTLKYGKQIQTLGYLVDGLFIIFCHLSRVVDTDSDSSLNPSFSFTISYFAAATEKTSRSVIIDDIKAIVDLRGVILLS